MRARTSPQTLSTRRNCDSENFSRHPATAPFLTKRPSSPVGLCNVPEIRPLSPSAQIILNIQLFSNADAVANGSAILSFSPPPGLIRQARHLVGSVPAPPFNDHRLGHLRPALDFLVPQALSGQQYDAGPQDIALGSGWRTDDRSQSGSLF
jgi:hypothetical protein